VVPKLERERERLLQALLGTFGVPELVLEHAQVVEEPPRVLPVAELVVDRPRLLGEPPRPGQLALAVGGERGLEARVRVRLGARSSSESGSTEPARASQTAAYS